MHRGTVLASAANGMAMIDDGFNVLTSRMASVVVVASDPDPEVLDAVLDDRGYDVVFIESMAGAYSSIKHLIPDMVVVCMAIDDIDSFQLLSMLAVDRDTAHIPVRTYVASPHHIYGGGGRSAAAVSHRSASAMN